MPAIASIEDLRMAQAAMLSAKTADDIKQAAILHKSVGFSNLMKLLLGKTPEQLKAE